MQKTSFKIARAAACGYIAAVSLAAPAHAGAETPYPAKHVRIITGSAGGGGDFAARLIAQGLTARLGQTVIVDNRGSVDGEVAAGSPADGSTLLIEGASLWISSLLQKLPYDPINDLTPITVAAITPNVLVVHPSVDAKSVKGLIALCKQHPGQLNFGSGGTGGAAHLAGELFKLMAGVNIVHVPFRGTGPAVTGIVGGQVQIAFINVAAVMPHVKAGRLRALAVGSAQSSPLTPGLPTVSESGLPGFESVLLLGVLAPSKVPHELIERLNQEIVAVLDEKDTRQRLFVGGEEPGGGSPEHFRDIIRNDLDKWGKVIRQAHIHVN